MCLFKSIQIVDGPYPGDKKTTYVESNPVTDGFNGPTPLTGISPQRDKLLEIPLWDKNDGGLSPLSPIRSPIVADWKAVGSPISPSGGEALEEAMLFETELKASVESVSSASPNRSRARRQRAMSMIERSIYSSRPFTPFDFDLDQPSRGSSLTFTAAEQERSSSSTNMVISGDTSKYGKSMKSANGSPDRTATIATAQVAQLPQLLHEELGLGNDEEATEIFRNSSMDSPDNGDSPRRPVAVTITTTRASSVVCLVYLAV